MIDIFKLNNLKNTLKIMFTLNTILLQLFLNLRNTGEVLEMAIRGCCIKLTLYCFSFVFYIMVFSTGVECVQVAFGRRSPPPKAASPKAIAKHKALPIGQGVKYSACTFIETL